MADHVCDLPVRARGSRFNSKPLAWGESIAIFCLAHARGGIFEKWDALLSSVYHSLSLSLVSQKWF